MTEPMGLTERYWRTVLADEIVKYAASVKGTGDDWSNGYRFAAKTLQNVVRKETHGRPE